MERKLAAILAADVVGYSRLMATDEAGTLARFKLLRADPIDVKLAQYRGRVVGSAGDSLLVEFASAVDAVQCAVELQERLAEHNADRRPDPPMAFRMGVNLGDVIADEGSIHGDGVNVAARLEKLAEPGCVVVSRAIHDQVKAKLPYAFAYLGEHTVHNIAEPVRAYRVQDAATSSVESRPTPSTGERLSLPDRPSIAVLAFGNMSGDPEQEYFSDGIAEDVITELSRFRGLFVIARNSSFAYKGRSVKVQDIARDLGVRYVVEGSVRKAANRVRVTAQLIDAETGGHVWAERYDRPLEDIFAVQDEIVEAIVQRLTRSLDDESIERVRRTPPANLTAYDRLLRARRDWVRNDFAAALVNLEAAVALDPNLAQAHALMAFLYAFEGLTTNPNYVNAEDRALDSARQALALDERDAYVHALVGWFYLYRGDHDVAMYHAERAVTLNPNDVTTMWCWGGTLAYVGRAREGLGWLEKALRVDPFGWSERWSEVFVESLYTARDYEGCIAAFRRMQNPIHYEFITAAMAYAQLGHLEEARAAVREFERRRSHYFTVDVFRQLNLRMFRQQEDADHWDDGLRKVGLIV